MGGLEKNRSVSFMLCILLLELDLASVLVVGISVYLRCVLVVVVLPQSWVHFKMYDLD